MRFTYFILGTGGNLESLPEYKYCFLSSVKDLLLFLTNFYKINTPEE
jgi:hypothetical protein